MTIRQIVRAASKILILITRRTAQQAARLAKLKKIHRRGLKFVALVRLMSDCRNGNPTACPAGRYSNGYTQETDTPCQPCEKGFSCPGSTKENICPAGSHAPEQSLEECLACPKGKYQGDAGQDKCLGCLAGYFCPERTVHPIPCGSVALFCPPNSTIVQAVGVGIYTTGGTETTHEGEAICEAGFACVGGKKKSCDGAGEYSQPGSGFCKKCSTGKFYNETANDCGICPKDTFASAGASNIIDCQECPAGGHSQPGSGFCEQCTAGEFYNETSFECELCPKNTFAISGANNITGCKPCDDGGLQARLRLL